jgi:hypothetical protein
MGIRKTQENDHYGRREEKRSEEKTGANGEERRSREREVKRK